MRIGYLSRRKKASEVGFDASPLGSGKSDFVATTLVPASAQIQR